MLGFCGETVMETNPNPPVRYFLVFDAYEQRYEIWELDPLGAEGRLERNKPQYELLNSFSNRTDAEQEQQRLREEAS